MQTKKKNISVHHQAPNEIPELEGYPQQLNQVWTNIIDNAIDAMDTNGTLRIDYKVSDTCIEIFLSDTGKGIPKEIQDKIFDPFFTTKKMSEGTGMGLDISRKIITQAHNGDLSVESEPGKTVFKVRLPRHNQKENTKK